MYRVLLSCRVPSEILQHLAQQIHALFDERTETFYKKGDRKIGSCGKFVHRIDYVRERLKNIRCFMPKTKAADQVSTEEGTLPN